MTNSSKQCPIITECRDITEGIINKKLQTTINQGILATGILTTTGEVFKTGMSFTTRRFISTGLYSM